MAKRAGGEDVEMVEMVEMRRRVRINQLKGWVVVIKGVTVRSEYIYFVARLHAVLLGV